MRRYIISRALLAFLIAGCGPTVADDDRPSGGELGGVASASSSLGTLGGTTASGGSRATQTASGSGTSGTRFTTSTTGATGTTGSGSGATTTSNGATVAAATFATAASTSASGTAAASTSGTGTTGSSGAGAVCASCATNAECGSGGQCTFDLNGSSVCEVPCSGSGGCSGSADTCQPDQNGGSGNYCFPSSDICGSSGTTSGTSGSSGTGTMCAACASNSDCGSGGQCTFDLDGSSVCEVPCTSGSGCSDPGGTCQPDQNGGSGNYCFPASDICGSSGSTGSSGSSGSSLVCAACTRNRNCGTGGECVQDANGNLGCAVPCTSGGGCSDPTAECQPFSNGESYCFPPSDTCS